MPASPFRLTHKALHAAAASLCLALCLPAVAAELDDDSVFYCPPSSTAPAAQPSKGIMCSAQQCFNSQTPGLSSAQKSFLLAQGQCRSLSSQEITDYWPKDLANSTQHANK